MIKIGKRVLMLLILALTLFYGNNLLVQADGNIIDNGICGEHLTWTLSKDGTLTISGTGEMYGFEYEYDESDEWIVNTPWRKHNKNLKKLVIEEGVTSIGNQAFNGCESLTGQLILPESITYIGEQAFNGCKSLTGQLILPESITYIGEQAFENCSGFTGDLVIPERVSVIEWCAFRGCSGFDGKLTLPAGVTKIREYAFNGCSGLTGQLILPENLTEIRYASFLGCNSFTGDLVIPEKVNYISDEAFRECEGFNGRLILSNALTYIGECAFYECNGFKGELVIPENLTEIEFGAFWGCSGFSGNLLIPDRVTKIEDYAFYNCKRLNGRLVISEGVTSIGESAFEGCSNLTGELKIPKSVKSIGTAAFRECKGFTGDLIIPEGVKKIEWGTFDECSGFDGNLVIPDSVKVIDDIAFSDCSGLTGNLIIPEGVTTIGEYAFSSCSGFTGNLIIPDEVTEINDGTFSGCSGFTGNLIIPESVTTIGEYAFSSCSGFTGNLIISESVTTIGEYAFCECYGFTGTLEIPESVTRIENGSFMLCLNFENITIPKATQTIKNDAFCDVPLIHNLSNAKGSPWGAIKVHNTSIENCSVCKKAVSAKRIWGKSRYMTSLAIADSLKLELGVDKFSTVIVASGQNFPDALAGSYLAAKKSAPILMVNEQSGVISLVQDYIAKNLVSGGKVYILGGKVAVPEKIERNLNAKAYDVERLQGADRYETNIAILEEAGVRNEEILVCTGTNFADSLSASAAGLPILLVNPASKKLTEVQKTFLSNKESQLTIIGGKVAVTEANRDALKIYDADNKVDRISGATRYETSVMVAKRYCGNPDEAVIAYAVNFPDGLCGGPLSYVKKAPMILTSKNYEAQAKAYIAEKNITVGTALGGETVLPDATVKKVFGMSDSDLIRGTCYD